MSVRLSLDFKACLDRTSEAILNRLNALNSLNYLVIGFGPRQDSSMRQI